MVQWLRDGLKLIASAGEIEALAASVPDAGGVYLVPAFAGLGAPHWDAYARGTMVGLTRGTTGAHLARAALEAIAFQSAEVLAAMQRDSGVRLAELRVDGGATANALLMQFQADLLGVPVVRPRVRGNDRARGGVSRRARGRRLGEPRRDRRAVAAGARLRAGDVARRGRRAVRRLVARGGAVEGLGGRRRGRTRMSAAPRARSSTAPQGQAANWYR